MHYFSHYYFLNTSLLCLHEVVNDPSASAGPCPAPRASAGQVRDSLIALSGMDPALEILLQHYRPPMRSITV